MRKIQFSPAMNATPVRPWLAYGAALTLCHGWQAKPQGETTYGTGPDRETALANGRENLAKWGHSADLSHPRETLYDIREPKPADLAEIEREGMQRIA